MDKTTTANTPMRFHIYSAIYKHTLMPQSRRVASPRAVKLTKKEQLSKALRAFHDDEHDYIRALHKKHESRTATAREKQIICDRKSRNEGMTQEELVKWARLYLNLDIGQSTISRTLAQREKHDDLVSADRASVRRQTSVKYPDIEEKVAAWFFKYEACVNLTSDLIRKKAERIRDDLGVPDDKFKASTGWLDGFKARHNITKRSRFGESGDVDMTIVEAERPKLCEVLDNVNWSCIYNMDETALFYQQEVGF